MGKALEVWEQDLSIKSESTNSIYRRNFKRFLDRFDINPDELFELRRESLSSDDPRDKQKVERMIKVLMSELSAEGYAANTVKNIPKAMSSFFEAQGLPLVIKAKDLPKGAANGQRLALAEHILTMHDYSSTQFKLRNRALLLFLKDSGVRVSDAAALDLRDWYEAHTIAHASGTFKVFSFETIKMKIKAFIHVGSECIEAVEKYLEKREARGYPMDVEGPLFISSPRHPGAKPGRFTADGLGQILIRMGSKVGVKKVSGHSLRKFHTTMLESAGVHENWVKKFQGKKIQGSMGPYSHPEEAGLLTETYIKAYPKLRIFREQASATQVKEQANKIADLEKLLDEERRKNRDIDDNIMKMRDEFMTRIEAMERRQKEHFDKDPR
jgi:integrase